MNNLIVVNAVAGPSRFLQGQYVAVQWGRNGKQLAQVISDRGEKVQVIKYRRNSRKWGRSISVPRALVTAEHGYTETYIRNAAAVKGGGQ